MSKKFAVKINAVLAAEDLDDALVKLSRYFRELSDPGASPETIFLPNSFCEVKVLDTIARST